MKRLLITICGRAGSKGFKNKNLKNFCGKPLVYYSLSAAELFIKKQEAIGAAQKQREIAKNLKKLGVGADEIVKATGLSVEDVEKL